MKPSSIPYGAEDHPPLSIALGSAMQQWLLALTTLGTLLLVIDEAKRLGQIDDAQAHTVVVASYLALGFATLLQTLRSRGVGAGFLIPSIFAAVFLPANLAALQVGGLGAVFGMTLFAGLLQLALAFVARRFPELFPTEVTGVVVMLIGLVLAGIAIRLMFPLSQPGGSGVAPRSNLPAGITIVTIIVLAVWCTGLFRAMCVMVGMVVGSLVSLVLADTPIAALIDSPSLTLAAWPVAVPSFHAELVFPYAAAALVCVLRAIGDITTAQRINDADWKHPDRRSIFNGLMADGLGNVASGTIGTVGLSTHSGAVGLSLATGVAARRVGFFVVGIHFMAALIPGFAALATSIPRPVLGAALLLSACFIVVNGMQAITSQALDNRKIILVALVLIGGLSRRLYPDLYAELPSWLGPLLSSELTVGVALLFCLVPLFRLGTARGQHTTLRLDGSQQEALVRFVQDSAAIHGARADVMDRAVMAATEFIELAPSLVDAGTPISVTSTYDGFTLRLTFRYLGISLNRAQMMNTVPNALDIDVDEDALRAQGVFTGQHRSVQMSFR